MKKRIACLFVAFALVFAMPMTAFAAGSAFDGKSTSTSTTDSVAWTEESTGNAFFMDHTANNISTTSDFYWVGSQLDATGLKIGTSGKGSLLAAGSTLKFTNIQVADSLRVAGSILSFDNAVVENNITVAGSNLVFGSAVKANGLYVAGSQVTVSGTYNAVSVSGSEIVVDSLTCNGDMSLMGSTITVGSGVTVKGVLYVPEGATVTIEDGAQVPTVTTVENNDLGISDSLDEVTAGMSALQIAFSCIAHILMVGLFFWLMRERLGHFAETASKNWGKIVIAGLVSFFVTPMLLVIGSIPLVTIPIVFLISVFMVLIFFCSIPFVGAALGQVFFKKMKPLTAGILLTVILTVLASLPYMTIAVMFACTVVMAGYIVTELNELRKRRKMERIQRAVNAAMSSDVPQQPIQ